ncbi:MAG: DNA double-strand break repair nuclease NurA [Candidatus Scalindua sediminis]|nr:DNA double-strand break repair nuclease NurA [Candidatus Scalindua sediminis]
MNKKEIPQEAIDAVARHINERDNKPTNIPIITIDGNTETPHYFEILPFDQIDNTDINFFAIDGSYNYQQFYNGLSVGIYTAGYICYEHGKQLRLNDLDDPIILGRSYYPNHILITSEQDNFAIFDELLTLEPVKNLIDFLGVEPKKIWGFGENARETISSNLSKLLSFCQEILEWSLIYEIASLEIIKPGDFILRDGTLRSNNIKQEYLVKLAEHLKSKELIIIAITKNSPIKLELSSSFKKIDAYLQDELKPKYPFTLSKDPKRQKLCCWFETSDETLVAAYSGNMYARKDITGGRGFGLFFAARLDYVEKLQNYDWIVVDLNIFDAIPKIKDKVLDRNYESIKMIFKELTRLTQEHYILGYPYPLVEAHNFVTLKKEFKEEIIRRVKFTLYKDQRMDNVEIENLFLDIHERF